MKGWVSLTRLFFKYGVEVIICIQGKHILGIIEKSSIIEKSNQLKQDTTDNLRSILREQTSLDSLLNTFFQYSVLHNQKKVLPVVNSQGKFVELWGYQELLQQLDYPIKNGKVAAKKSDLTQEKNLEKEQENKMSQQFLVELVLETLPIRLLALGVSGDILFYNADWSELEKKYPDLLDIKIIFREAKKKMFHHALEDEQLTSLKIDPDMTFSLTILPCKNTVQMKFIHFNDKVIGYLFWIFK